ncbi:putative transporter [Mycobacterium kiyosense]|uniref:Transporter n=2 Tax=Mycobacteriaceae TaxID=1762 RepID=A0A9P3UWS6_9MYCO|nr:putative transporter [Mycobacterium kiyosense]BDE12535.1 putative transporter [Mycobacterium sp. 20KCMC460]GLB85846.1 putative transporter [Mycobacterium kiyosense]GLB91023.1 putative transporter [Mycobacterium kiyosense]GLB96976.1 putative transporter [Mycobacterium kiyosense]
MLGINAIIGAGIFLTPGAVIKLAGPLAPLAYVLAGLFAGIMAMVFATAARYVRTNGASYAYTNAAFGQRLAIYVGVTHAVIASIAWGVLASLFVSTLLKVVFPQRHWSEDTELFSVKTLTFLGFVAVLLTINLFGNRVIRWANGISTLGKVFALSVFILGGLWIVAAQHVNNYADASAPDVYRPAPYALLGFVELGQSTVSGLVLATVAALYAFTGFESIANAAEEMHQPERTLPRAIPLAIAAVGTVYVLAVTVAMLLGSDKIVGSRDTVKLAAAIENDALRTIVVLGALVSMFGINVAASFGAPRLWSALSDTGTLPVRLSRKNRFGVPMAAFGVTAALALAFPLALRFDNDNLIGLAVIARFIQFIIVPIALMELARSPSADHADVRRNLFTDKVLPVAAVLISGALAVSFDYRTLVLTPQGGANYFSIVLLALTFVAVPAAAYVHYYRSADRTESS